MRTARWSSSISKWAGSFEVYGGLSLEDYIAFPYGKNAVEGAKADYESGVTGW